MEEQQTPQPQTPQNPASPDIQPVPPATPSQDSAQAAGQTAPAEGPKRVLCIEDERFIAELYRRSLEKSGFAVDIIPDGQLGLDAALTDDYDVILLDIMVPQIMGVDILPKLRAHQPPLKAKIIVATNLEQDKQLRANMENAADGYIIKAEVTPNEVTEMVRRLV